MKTTHTKNLILRFLLPMLILFGSNPIFSQLNCPNDGSDIIGANTTGQCDAQVEVIANLGSTTCANPNPTFSSDVSSGSGLDASGIYPVGTTTVTFSICDGQFTCDVDVVVADEEAPEIMATNDTLYLDLTGSITITAEDIDKGSTDNCGIATLTIDEDEFDCGDIGPDNEVTITATDVNGITSDSLIMITVLDTLPPNCVNNADLQVQLGIEKCDTIYEFDLPTAMDNCDGPIAGMPIPGEPMSGDALPIGITTVRYTLTDNSDNTDTCSFDIEVLEYVPDGLACKGNINFSLDPLTCLGEAKPLIFLADQDLGCADSCTVTITTLDDEPHSNTFDINDIDQTFKYEVCCAGVCCWGYVNVEYKYVPEIECSDMPIITSCVGADNVAPPVGNNNCANLELIIIGETQDMLACDPDYVGEVTRTYQFEDADGNLVGESCEQTILLERVQLDSVDWPEHRMLANNRELKCPSSIDPSITGSPFINGLSVFPNVPDELCNIYVDFEDYEIPTSNDCVQKTMRTWTIGEWHCTNPEPITYQQIIEVVDNEAPVFLLQIPDMTISTDPFACSGTAAFDLPAYSDNCNEEGVTFDLQLVNDTPGFITGYEGGPFTLPAGFTLATLYINDICGNTRSMDIEFVVRDDADPIAICNAVTTVGIGLDSITYVTAEAVDDLSFDECSDVTLQIARMDDLDAIGPAAYAPTAPIYCDDVGTLVMVSLLVTDAGGNTNLCMAEVEVQDKIQAQIDCPADITVPCDFAYNDMQLDEFFGEVTIYDNCPGETTLQQSLSGTLNGCGVGQLIRTVRAFNEQGQQQDVCTQRITFLPGPDLQYSDITPPTPELTFFGCGDENVVIGEEDMPSVDEQFCQQIGIKIDQETFPTTIDSACLKIIRTYSVVNWCKPSGLGSLDQPFEFTQTIRIFNNEAPTFTSVPEDAEVCSYSGTCEGVEVEDLAAVPFDECTIASELNNSYEVYDSKGTETTSDDVFLYRNDGTDASGYYDVGDYRIRYISEDKCGNSGIAEVHLKVESCKAPTPYCKNGLVTNIGPMDLDGNGTIDGNYSMLNPSFFDLGSAHVCPGISVTLSFSEDPNDTIRLFDESHVAELQEVDVYVIDEEGRFDFCTTYLDVQDNEFVVEGVTVTGRIYMEDDREVEEVEVALEGSDLDLDMTTETGLFAFPEMPMGGNYKINPDKDFDDMNGVSTLDLVLIQRHLLQLQDLDSPYKMIAADINRDDKISASDLVALRKVILGIDAEYPDNTSWRFIDGNYTFADPTDPWSSDIPEDVTIINLNNHMWSDFIAVKVGDVNGNVELNLNGPAQIEARSTSDLALTITDKDVLEGNTYEVSIAASEAQALYGFQFSLALNGLEIEEILENQLQMTDQHFHTDGQLVHMSYAQGEGADLGKDIKLFTMIVHAKKDGRLSEMMHLSSKGLAAESYINESLEKADIEIEWTDELITETDKLVVHSNTPNPWSNSTKITMILPSDGAIVFSVLDARGQQIFSMDKDGRKGKNEITLTKKDLPQSGIYFYDIAFKGENYQGKMVKIN